MRRRLPPLNSVRAFEAAARHLSFVEAADELAVTPSAISQQVKSLEEWLGLSLFRRLPRGLAPTEDALRYLPPLTEALDQIDQASQSVRSRPPSRALTVTCLASFGAQWLTPRLHRFDALHPDIDVMLATFDRLVDLEREDVDIAIRYGKGQYPNLHVDELMQDDLGIVCSPRLIDHPVHPIRRPEDLVHHTLLHDSDARLDGRHSWPLFLEAMGVQGVDATRGPSFNDSHMMIQSCIAGRGVIIGRSGLVGDALAEGLLVAPFGMTMKAEYRYRMMMLPSRLSDPKVQAFRRWIFDELGRAPPD